MKKIFILIIAFSLGFSFNSNAQNEDEIKAKLITASGEEMYLKDFMLTIKPGEESISSVVLSKRTTYGWYVFINKDLEIALLDDNENVLLNPKLFDNEIASLTLRCNKTGIYHLHIKNISQKTITTGVLLTFAGKFEPKNLEAIAPKVQTSDTIVTTKSESTDTKEIPDEVFFVVEKMPKFNGKASAEFIKYLNSKIEYPQEAINKRIQGRVFVQFTINKSGYIEDAKVVRGVHPSLDQEALRIVYSSPRWEPGKQKGDPVNVIFAFPIIFKLK
ncbi:MAG: energy transducer TonB [Bacteroidales bacterium]|nr:energy transducer TonB [Bacteroidales bacterium]